MPKLQRRRHTVRIRTSKYLGGNVVRQPVAWDNDYARSVLVEHEGQPGALLPMLHALQEVFGYVDPQAVPVLAEVLNVSKADVYGVISFYHDFRTTPPPRHVLKICRAEACQAVGGDGLADHACQKLGVKFGEETSDGRVGLEAVYCLGLCSTAPSAMFDGRLVARLDRAKLDELVTEARQ